MIRNDVINIVECPRDAMQGWNHFIPTAEKIRYINALMKVGFDTIDFGSFVSPKVIPQMKDTREVLAGLDFAGTSGSSSSPGPSGFSNASNSSNSSSSSDSLNFSSSSSSSSSSNSSSSSESSNTSSSSDSSNSSSSSGKLLAIVANLRGAEEASLFHQIDYLGYPFSVSETFQLRNANATIDQSLETVAKIAKVCHNSNKKLVVYMSMAFGNPYGDAYAPGIVYGWVEKINNLGVDIISLADTVGLSTSEQVFTLTDYLIKSMPAQEFGVHLHSGPGNWQQKLQAALDAGCRRFDGALKGIGGCPMADDVLVGNMNTEWMIGYFESQGFKLNLNKTALEAASEIAGNVFI